jgi:hypothetical protein
MDSTDCKEDMDTPQLSQEQEFDGHQSVPSSERDKFLELVRDISSDLDVSVLSCKILSNVAILTSADRCSLFLVKGTGKNRALVAQLFDVRKNSVVPELDNQTEVRIPWGKGIIGQVAISGNGITVPDAYEVTSYDGGSFVPIL